MHLRLIGRCFVLPLLLTLAACGVVPAAAEPALPIPSLTPTAVQQPAPPTIPAAPLLPTLPAATPTPAPTATLPPEPTVPLVLEPTRAADPALPAPTSPAATPQVERIAPTVQQEAAPAVSRPVRLVIEAIELDRKLVSVGLDRNRIPIVPDHDAAWYNLSAMPGQGENVVLWGHVLRFRKTPGIPAPFARLKELAPGARILLYDANGTPHAYRVTQQTWVTPDQVEYILPQGQERLTLVSCIGDKVVVDGSVEMTHRLITIAEPETP